MLSCVTYGMSRSPLLHEHRQRRSSSLPKIQVENLSSQEKEWCEPPVIPALKLPGPNPFVPRDLSVIKPKGRVVKPGEKIEAPAVVLVFPTTAGWKVCVCGKGDCLSREQRLWQSAVL